ncbi:hypothetical protein IHE55_25475 [Streptomyces pactum]|uniref:DUF3040 domain-containing protein n=1 Tax=Streptomyces pactum TaxID=68249 RepID=A0ABS0NRX2_9ACTN|nr:hypothetical protein [Streptomyces pactum]MBH5337947.1 hypothetical protein [Streptomyces pactum]
MGEPVTVAVGDRHHPADTEDELRSLLRWLDRDESLRDRVRGRIRGNRAPEPGAMGAGFDILQLTIGSGLSVGALVVSVLQWRDARRTRPVLTLRRGGVEVVVPADGTADEETVRRVVALLGEGAGPGPAGTVPPDTSPAPAGTGDGGGDGGAGEPDGGDRRGGGGRGDDGGEGGGGTW